MAGNTDDFLKSILDSFDLFEYIKPEDIPNIDLYMDQVTTFMDKKLRSSSRYPEEDKVMTKTMINNYAKNDLLPPPVKKKYSREHVMLLVFIYYYKGILSIGDIQTLLAPITERFFRDGTMELEKIYYEIFETAHVQKDQIKEDVARMYEAAQRSFADAPKEDAEILRMFSFICQLSVDVYLKKQIIERLIDHFAAQNAGAERTDKPGKPEKSSRADQGGREAKEK